MTNISKGIRKLKRPQYTSVIIDNNKNKAYLNSVFYDGSVKLMPISKKVAEILIARGMAYQG